MDINFDGLIVGVGSFLLIGICHPIVIKTEYYFGTRPWVIFLLLGLAAVTGSLFVADFVVSTLLAVLGFCLFWSIGELFQQRKRVEKGWFPSNPKRRHSSDL